MVALERRIWSNTQLKENRRLKEIPIQRGDLLRLKKAFHEGKETEKPALTDIRDNLRKCVKILCRAECHHSVRKPRMRERVAFTKNPLNYLLQLLDNKGWELRTTKEEAEEHLL